MADHLLGSYATGLQDYARKALNKRKVVVRLNTSVVRVDPDSATMSDGHIIPTETLIWAAGITANVPQGFESVERVRGGRLVVDGNLRLTSHPRVFAVGDVAAMTDEHGQLLPQVATPAIQAARLVARIIRTNTSSSTLRRFRYRDLGQMATIGRHSGVVQLPNGLRLRGWFAWLGWLLLHLVKIIGFKNRPSILLSWVWNYMTYDRAARLIFENGRRASDAK